MTFPFIHSLPAIGTRESDTLDFKREVSRLPRRQCADRFELAKDVASFANQSGGTILVGVGGGSVCQAFEPLADADADWLAREYEEAVRDRCAPPPSIRTEKLPCNGGVILAVHVPPFPFSVAVKVKGDEADGYGADAWVFFLRIASQNRPFRPEVLPMLTPEVRRIAVLLRSIPQFAKVNVSKRTRHEGGRLDYSGLEVESIDETANRVSLAGMNGMTRVVHTFPLDCVRTAWADPTGRWFMEVDHYFENRS